MLISFRSSLSLLGFAVAFFISSEASAVSYDVVNLGRLQAGATIPYAVNDSGQVVGASYINGIPYAFLYSGGTIQNLGTLGGNTSTARGINNAGVVVGSAALSTGTMHAFSYNGGPLQSLGTATTSDGQASYLSSAAFDVNASGQVVGSSSRFDTDGLSNSAAVLFENGTVTVTGYSLLQAINDAGVMVGIDNGHGYSLSGSTYTSIPGFCIGTFCGSNPEDINNLGIIVGDAGTYNARHAFMFANGTLTDLGTLGGAYSIAHGINELSQIVGGSDSTSGRRAFLYSSGAMQDLNSLIDPSSGWILREASDINESGQIVGWGLYNGQVSGFLLTPVPLPGTLWLILSGFAALVCWRRK